MKVSAFKRNAVSTDLETGVWSMARDLHAVKQRPRLRYFRTDSSERTHISLSETEIWALRAQVSVCQALVIFSSVPVAGHSEART